jgi:type I restriction enzyme S subunit
MGTTKASRNRFKEIFFLDFVIPLPSLKEQHRTVTTLEHLMARIENARRESIKESIGLLFIKSLKKIHEDSLKHYPNKKIGGIFEATSGGTPSREISTYWNGDISWVKTGELLDNDIFNTEEHITKLGLENSAAKLFPKDTILIALYGQGQTRGRTARLMIEATTNQACCAILPKPEIMESRFLQYWLRGLYHEMREKYRDGAQPNWNGKMIKEIKIAFPPLPEQRRIVAHLDRLQAKVDEVKRLQTETQQEMEALVPSVLAKAFVTFQE